MSVTAVHAIPVDEIETQVVAEPAAKTGTAKRMFQYSEYVDVGEGAAECENSRDGKCRDIEHFHAWCRLPNPYQHQDIRAKGLAAKARRIRLLKDVTSDPAVVMDQQLEDEGVEALIEDLMVRDWSKDYLEASTDVEEREEFEHIVQDREEYTRLAEGDEPEERQTDEYKQLAAHMRKYLDAVNEALDDIQNVKRESHRARPVQEVIALVRAGRVEEEANRAFIEDYNAWMWFVGTFKVTPDKLIKRPSTPTWDEIGRRDRGGTGTMFGEAPEVIEALKETFNTLTLAMQRGSAGN
jgi:hypothetical protein